MYNKAHGIQKGQKLRVADTHPAHLGQARLLRPAHRGRAVEPL